MVKEQQHQQPPVMVDEDFDDLSLFVSGSGSSSLRSFNLNTTDSSSSLSGLQVETESPEEVEMSVDAENEQVCVFLELFLIHMDLVLRYYNTWDRRERLWKRTCVELSLVSSVRTVKVKKINVPWKVLQNKQLQKYYMPACTYA